MQLLAIRMGNRPIQPPPCHQRIIFTLYPTGTIARAHIPPGKQLPKRNSFHSNSSFLAHYSHLAPPPCLEILSSCHKVWSNFKQQRKTLPLHVSIKQQQKPLVPTRKHIENNEISLDK